MRDKIETDRRIYTIMKFLQQEIAKSSSYADRATMTDMLNFIHVGELSNVENLCERIEKHNNASEEIKVIANWVKVLLINPDFLITMYQTHIH